MNKKLLIIVIGIIVLISLALSYVFFSNKQDTPAGTEQVTTITSNEDIASDQPKQIDTRDGSYLDYSDTAIATTQGTKVLFFHAPWCPQCREIEQSIKEDGIPSGVSVIKVDYDSNQALRQQYAVTIQTTFVKIDDDGNKIESYVAYEEPQFKSVERELLE